MDSFGTGLEFFGLSIEALKVLDSDKLLQGVLVSVTIFHSWDRHSVRVPLFQLYLESLSSTIRC